MVRVFDIGRTGGFTTNAFWINEWVRGSWRCKKGASIDSADFKTYPSVNITPFSSPGVLFNANIAPLTKIAIKGCIWYQGESNADRAQEYQSLFPALIKDWRKAWQDDKLPFYFVQLANYGAEDSKPSGSHWAELREAQAMALSLPNTGMAVTIDIGEANDIHPKNKVDVGTRLAFNALKTTYHRDIIAQGPVMEEVKFEKGFALISFRNLKSPLWTKNKFGYIHGFALAEKDQTFFWAKAEISNGQIKVYSNRVSDPVAVRYAWSNNPGSVDLYNQAGLPAPPFRSDQWPAVTQGKTFNHLASRF